MIEIIESRGWRGERYALRCMSCGVSEGACPCAESECHYPTWERRVERTGQLPLLGGAV